jgi:hypothetical protein
MESKYPASTTTENLIEEEKIREEQITLFIQAVQRMDIHGLEKLLHDEFLYFENKTKAETWSEKLFSEKRKNPKDGLRNV